jgi:hypothetical protein
MNCQNFENILEELLRGALMDARTRETALAHADSCRRCDARLEDEKALRAGLRSLAASASGEEASPRVEAALLAAFRAQAGTGVSEKTSAPVVPHTNVAPLARRAADRQWSWIKTVATAASAAAAAAILLMIIPPGMDTPQPGGNTVAGTQMKNGQKEVNSQVSKMIEPVPNFDNKDEVAPTVGEVAEVEQPRAFGSPHGGGRMTATPVGYNPSGGRRQQTQRGTSRGPRPAEEVVTEFIPLGHGDYYLASVDAGQVLRVELPRSALSSIGMPVSADRASERIKADVLVGEDGVARAIRFVR